MGFSAPITAMLLCGRSQDSLLSVSGRRLHVVYSTAAFKYGEASRKPRALGWDRAQAIGHGFYPLSNPNALH